MVPAFELTTFETWFSSHNLDQGSLPIQLIYLFLVLIYSVNKPFLIKKSSIIRQKTNDIHS